MKKTIGILECGRPAAQVGDKWGNHPALFAKFLGDGFDYAQWAVFENQFPASVYDCQGWLITGSKYGAYEDHDWIPPLEAFIREAYAQGVPVYGVCFGHQIMAQALGGKVEKFDGGWALGRQEYARTDGSTLAINAYHQDQVVQLPPDAQPTASNAFCQYAALAYKGRAASIQPHPEFEAPYFAELAGVNEDSFPAQIFSDAMREADKGEAALTRDKVAQEMRAFFEA